MQAQPQTDYSVAERSAHETVWERVTWSTNRLGSVFGRTNSFVELATGLNFFDPTTQQWQPSREEWQAYPDAILASAGRHKVILAHNLNLGGSADVLAADGVRLVLNPVGLGFFDPVDGKRTILAAIKDCAPSWGAATNEIVFRDCFDGIRGSIRYLYTKAGFHQHVVLEQRLELPAGFSDRSRVECYTEFAPNTPWPQIETRVLRREKDPVLRAQMVEPDFTDSRISFGEMSMGSGIAFTLGDATEAHSIRVGKRFEMIAGRPVLTEAVEWRELEPLLSRLSSAGKFNGRKYAVNSSRAIPQAKASPQLPREHFHAFNDQKQIQLASQPLSEPAVVQ